jgi:GAF domain-containing protein
VYVSAESVNLRADANTSAVVLQAMADQIAVALNNAEQFKQTEIQARQLTNLNQFSRSLFAASKAEDLYRVLAAALNSIVPHNYLSLTFTQSNSATLREYSLKAEADPALTEGPVWSMANTLSGRACTTRQPVVSMHFEQDAALDDVAQWELAGFRSALSLPLIIGERVLGTLNFASVSPQAYSLENAPQLEQIAGQVAVALENQRLAQAQQKSLQEMEALTRQLTGQAWAKRRQRQATESVQYARSGIDTDLPASTPEIEAAIEIQQPIVRSDLDNSDNHSLYQAALAVPIVLRGEVLGGLQVSEAGQAREWTEDDLTFLQAVADQVALALDNARLIEEAERRAERERLVADISTRMFAANDLESILQIAGDELGRVLRVKQTTVKVRSELAAALVPPGSGQTPDQRA